jgi:alkanesulfonate monooxygenase SsuD/methylene tetrahydromethanopterin reductase-like flavin-dependent oxidoreductase (luciferase family)
MSWGGTGRTLRKRRRCANLPAMALLGIRFDLRNPESAGTTTAERCAAALDMAEWADRMGFMFVVLSEHHGSPDGYLPSPLPMAAAVAARTERIIISVAAMVASFHDPLRLAEDAAVVDNLAQGRLQLIIANGYVPDEFAMFDAPLADRAKRTTEAVRVLQQAGSGQPFEHRGRQVRVTPPAFQPTGVSIALGGTSDAAARRAARLGVGFMPSTPAVWDAYRDECAAQGHPDPGPALQGDSTVTVVAADVDAWWDELGRFALHEANEYGAWAEASGIATGYTRAGSVDELRASGQYDVVTPAQLVEHLDALGPLGLAVFHPMLGGIPPSAAWESLRLLETEVLPHLT